MQMRVTAMVAVMLVAFLITWLPYAIVALITAFGYGDLLSPAATTVPGILCKLSLISDPVVYIFMNPQVGNISCALAPGRVES